VEGGGQQWCGGCSGGGCLSVLNKRQGNYIWMLLENKTASF
jgi:hypothetical protein